MLAGKSNEEKLHHMLTEEFWGADVNEESGIQYGPFKHAFKFIASMFQLLGRLGTLMLTLLMWHEVQTMGFLNNYCLRLGL